MEGPTVATTETPAVLSSRSFPSPPDEDETHAQPGPPARRRTAALEPSPDEEDAKRTMRLDRPRGDLGFDPTPAVPFTPAEQPGSGPRGAFSAGSSGPALAQPPRVATGAAPPYAAAVHTPAPVRQVLREQPTPNPHAQAAWLPHQEAPLPRPAAAVKPQAIRIAEIGLAALVVITLSIGGCLLMQNR